LVTPVQWSYGKRCHANIDKIRGDKYIPRTCSFRTIKLRTMLSKNKQKLIRSLQQKKYRDRHGLFLAEGCKIVEELLQEGAEAYILAGTEKWIREHSLLLNNLKVTPDLLGEKEMKSVSLMSTPQEVLAVFRKPVYSPARENVEQSISLALDNIQDPGNLGTIIRMAEWFGIHDIFCSPGTADAFNPKVVQATMGSLFRVKVHYIPLEEVLERFPPPGPPHVYGTFPDGDCLYDTPLDYRGIIVLGNEGSGISPALLPRIHRKISIPSHPGSGLDSLNVAVSAAVVCAEFRRRQRKVNRG